MTVLIQPRPLNVRKTVFVASVLVAFFIYTYFIRDPAGPAHLVLSGETMGTTYTIKIADSPLSRDSLRALSADIRERLADINRQMSTYLPDSEISRFNHSTTTNPVAVSPEFALVTRKALAISEATGGAFDPTLEPLIALWGFGQSDRPDSPPRPDQIRDALARCGFAGIKVPTETEIQKQDPGLQLNLSAIAKGYGVDALSELLAGRALTNTYVEIGGELRVRGHNPDRGPWRIGIDTPVDHAATGDHLSSVLALHDRAVATSGDYRNYYEDDDGTRRSHLIDPRTGAPISHRLASATVLAPDCMTADAVATALMVLGPDEGLAWIEQQPGLESLLIVRTPDGFHTRSSPGIAGLTADKP